MTRRRRLCLGSRQEESINDPVNFNRASFSENLVKTHVSYIFRRFPFLWFLLEKLPNNYAAEFRPVGSASIVFAAFIVCFFFRNLIIFSSDYI